MLVPWRLSVEKIFAVCRFQQMLSYTGNVPAERKILSVAVLIRKVFQVVPKVEEVLGLDPPARHGVGAFDGKG